MHVFMHLLALYNYLNVYKTFRLYTYKLLKMNHKQYKYY